VKISHLYQGIPTLHTPKTLDRDFSVSPGLLEELVVSRNCGLILLHQDLLAVITLAWGGATSTEKPDCRVIDVSKRLTQTPQGHSRALPVETMTPVSLMLLVGDIDGDSYSVLKLLSILSLALSVKRLCFL
jgi:hypothetical protein